MNKQLLKRFYLLQEAIQTTEREIFNQKYFEGNGFVYSEDVWDAFYVLYKEFDAEEYSILDSVTDIVRSKGYWDTDLLTEEHKKKFSVGGSTFALGITDCILMNKEFYKTCGYCFIKLETLNEALDFMQSKGWIE